MRPVFHLLGLAFAVALIASPAQGKSKTNGPAPDAAVKAPDVALKIIPERDGAELQGSIDLVVIVTNNSAMPLKNVVVSTQSNTFEQTSATLAAEIAAFRSVRGTVVLKPRETDKPSSFGAHKAAVTVSYGWKSSAGKSMTSEQTEAVSLTLLRRFDEEGKSLPGGTATFLYLILPLVPAFFAYDLVDRRRRGEPFAMPTFGTEQIVPAFLLAFLLSIGFVAMHSFSVETAYTDPKTFLAFLAASAGLGALIPGVRWIYAAIVNRLWGFKATDTAKAYLTKALSSPYLFKNPVWIEGTAGGLAWKGMQLRQPDGTLALGARLQVSPANPDVKLDEVKNALVDRSRLFSLIKAGKVKIGALDKIERGPDKLGGFVVAEGLTQFQMTTSTSKSLVEAIP